MVCLFFNVYQCLSANFYQCLSANVCPPVSVYAECHNSASRRTGHNPDCAVFFFIILTVLYYFVLPQEGKKPRECPDNDGHNTDALDGLVNLPPVVFMYKFSKVSSRLDLLHKIAIELTSGNFHQLVDWSRQGGCF